MHKDAQDAEQGRRVCDAVALIHRHMVRPEAKSAVETATLGLQLAASVAASPCRM